MIENLQKRRFVVTRPLALTETDRQMKPGEEGFAYIPLADPVEIEVDTFPYTAQRSSFKFSIEWRSC
jgi:hypothetical protein